MQKIIRAVSSFFLLTFLLFACGDPSKVCDPQAPPKEGLRCVEGRYVSLCSADLDCQNSERCEKGLCTKTSCSSAPCSDGETSCTTDKTGLRTCQRQNDGCLAWSSTTPCVLGETCSQGKCAKTPCPSAPCSDGETSCTPDRAGTWTCYRRSDGCLAWSIVTPCFSGCANGVCSKPPCPTVPCNEGELSCTSDKTGTLACQRQSDGCLAWSAPQACPSGESCAQGKCAKPPCPTAPCNDGDLSCTSDKTGTLACQRQSDGCLAWSAPKTCPSGESCAQGKCAKPPCPTAPCNEGELSCTSDKKKTRLCQRQADGCLAWVDASQACGAEEECNQGACVLKCNLCNQGALRCDTSGASVQKCIKKADGCTTWDAGTSCNGGPCSGGVCLPFCLYNGQAVQTCPSDRSVCEGGHCCKVSKTFCKVGEFHCSQTKPVTMECVQDGPNCVDAVERPCVGGKACVSCKIGETRCSPTVAEEIETCQKDAAGCLVWNKTATCSGGKACVAGGSCALHECPVEAAKKCGTTKTQFQVEEAAAFECVRDLQGRLRWKVAEICYFANFGQHECKTSTRIWDGNAVCYHDNCHELANYRPYCEIASWRTTEPGASCLRVREDFVCPLFPTDKRCFEKSCVDSTHFVCAGKPIGVWFCENNALLKCEQTPQGKWLKQARGCAVGCKAAPATQDAVCTCENESRRCVNNQEEKCVAGAWQKIRDCKADEECKILRATASPYCYDFPVVASEQATVDRVTYCQEMEAPLSRCHVKASFLQPSPP